MRADGFTRPILMAHRAASSNRENIITAYYITVLSDAAEIARAIVAEFTLSARTCWGDYS